MKTRLYKTRYFCTKNDDGSMNYWSPLDDFKLKMGSGLGSYFVLDEHLFGNVDWLLNNR